MTISSRVGHGRPRIFVAILAETVLPEDSAGAGDLLWSIWDGIDVPDGAIERDKTPYRPISLE